MGFMAGRGGLSDPIETETIRVVASLVREGLAFRCARTVFSPVAKFGGDWGEPTEKSARIVTYHLTDAGRARWIEVG
jgi:hypothetical protein